MTDEAARARHLHINVAPAVKRELVQLAESAGVSTSALCDEILCRALGVRTESQRLQDAMVSLAGAAFTFAEILEQPR